MNEHFCYETYFPGAQFWNDGDVHFTRDIRAGSLIFANTYNSVHIVLSVSQDHNKFFMFDETGFWTWEPDRTHQFLIVSDERLRKLGF